jgi:hypothetical protein
MLLRQCHRDAVVPGPSPPIAFNAAYESLAEATAAENKATGYLRGGAGCVTTAAWWCQKQPPRPMAAAMVMAKAIKMRIAFPSFLPSTPEKRELLAAVAWNTKQSGAVAAEPQHCFESPG